MSASNPCFCLSFHRILTSMRIVKEKKLMIYLKSVWGKHNKKMHKIYNRNILLFIVKNCPTLQNSESWPAS